MPLLAAQSLNVGDCKTSLAARRRFCWSHRRLATLLTAAAATVMVTSPALTACAAEASHPLPIVMAVASDSALGFPAIGAADGERFSVDSEKAWKGSPASRAWTWTADLGKRCEIGAVLQIVGDDESAVGVESLAYEWQASDDGDHWQQLPTTRQTADRRMYRLHRLEAPVRARYVRISIADSIEQPPTIREVEIYADCDANVEFPTWFAAINSYDVPSVDTCDQFLTLARKCKGWESIRAQFLWHGYLSSDFVTAEPRPLCLFFTGSHADWCQVDPATWKATAEILNAADVPIWAACGGAQAFGILSDNSNGQKWDCPKCRDAAHPKSPIYGHIGAVDKNLPTECGDYSNNLYELGPTPVRVVQADPVFNGLPDEFLVPEYHCGQLEYLPAGWDLVATKGKGGKTWMQCMKKRDSAIYAAQFHIELEGAPENSQRIMSNFLKYATDWSAEHAANHGGRAAE